LKISARGFSSKSRKIPEIFRNAEIFQKYLEMQKYLLDGGRHCGQNSKLNKLLPCGCHNNKEDEGGGDDDVDQGVHAEDEGSHRGAGLVSLEFLIVRIWTGVPSKRSHGKWVAGLGRAAL